MAKLMTSSAYRKEEEEKCKKANNLAKVTKALLLLVQKLTQNEVVVFRSEWISETVHF